MNSMIKVDSDFKTMFLLVLCLSAIVVQSANVTIQVEGEGHNASQSRMAWLKMVLDHHEWTPAFINNTNVQMECREELEQYVDALNQGKIWASKIYDASGQYTPNIMFGSDYWLGSIDACVDLQLKKYYDEIPPFKLGFITIKINVSLHDGHLPQSRILFIGECLPATCKSNSVKNVVQAAIDSAQSRAQSSGVPATLALLTVRPVPGPYNLFTDPKVLIVGSTVILVLLLMLVSSFWEGYLERKYRMSNASSKKDLELSNNHNNNIPHNHKAIPTETSESDKEIELKENKELRRETCGLWSELLLSFSVLTNGRTILNTQKPADGALTCLHGMRFMSVIWVIMVHTYLTVFYVADNKTLRTVTERNIWYQSIGNASYSVDTFFFISGLLVTILFLRSEEKKQKKKEQEKHEIINKNGFTNSALSVSVSVISQDSFEKDLMEKPKTNIYTIKEIMHITKTFLLMLFYRFIRLTPAYAFVIGLNEIALRYTHNNAVFEPAIYDHITCDLFWWRNLLYINNLYPQREMCMVWSWYMANDTQFYAVGIILLLISVKHLKFSVISLGILMVSSWATTIYISVWHQYKARIQEPFEMFDALYDKPWSRIGPYFVGMIVAWYLHRTKCQIKIPYWLVMIAWPASLAIMGSLIFGMIDGYFEVWPTAFYVSIGHTAWGVALAWVTIACCSGYGGLVNSALSYRGLLPLSRLTYCAYLVHPTLMMYVSFLMDGPLHLQNSMVITIYAGFAVMAFLSSFAISLAFEAPAVRLLKIINHSTGRRTPPADGGSTK